MRRELFLTEYFQRAGKAISADSLVDSKLDTDSSAKDYRNNVLHRKLTAFVKQLTKNVIQRYLVHGENRDRKGKNVGSTCTFKVA